METRLQLSCYWYDLESAICWTVSNLTETTWVYLLLWQNWSCCHDLPRFLVHRSYLNKNIPGLYWYGPPSDHNDAWAIEIKCLHIGVDSKISSPRYRYLIWWVPWKASHDVLDSPQPCTCTCRSPSTTATKRLVNPTTHCNSSQLSDIEFDLSTAHISF